MGGALYAPPPPVGVILRPPPVRVLTVKILMGKVP